MTSKSYNCYLSVLEYIERHIFQMKPDEIITDFEGGMRKAIKSIYPNSILRGCWYHFCCAVSRNFNSFGLRQLLTSNASVKMIKYKILSLPLLPKKYFYEGYNQIQREVKEYNLNSNFQPFFDYFKYWLNEVHYIQLKNEQ